MIKVLWRAALIVMCSALAACAGDDGPHRFGEGQGQGEGGGPGGAPRRLPNVFISPAGEPFRAAPGEPYPVSQWFARADADHDGRLSRAEFKSDAAAFFAKLDVNHDGVIDGLELQDYEQTVAPEILPRIEGLHAMEGFFFIVTLCYEIYTDTRPGRGRQGLASKQPEPPRGIGVQGAAVYSLVNTPEPIAAADAQLDGRITRAEFAAAVDRRFDLLDKAGAGYLTLAALPKTPIQTAILKRKAQTRRPAERSGQTPPAPGDEGRQGP